MKRPFSTELIKDQILQCGYKGNLYRFKVVDIHTDTAAYSVELVDINFSDTNNPFRFGIVIYDYMTEYFETNSIQTDLSIKIKSAA